MSKDDEITDLFELRQMFQRDTEKTISIIYNNYRESFLQFSKKYTVNEVLIVDAFQDAVIALYQNLMEDKITSNNSKVKTYLFEIGKHKLFNGIRKESNIYKIQNEQPNYSYTDTDYNEEVSLPMKEAIGKLGKTCKKLLILYYYRKYSINAIMYELNMKTENSVKANKSRCLKKMRLIING